MSDFRTLNDTVLASPQITLEDVAIATAQGVSLIVNNRPEGESADQTPGDAIEAAARAAGMEYLAIPITHAGFSLPQVDALVQALAQSELAVETVVALRNKVVEAYQEILRMPV